MKVSTQGRLIVEFQGRKCWLLQDSLRFIITEAGKQPQTISVPALFCTDGASVPALLQPLVPRWHRKWGKAAVLHDFLYANPARAEMLGTLYGMKGRRFADACMHAAMETTWRRAPIWLALRLFGWMRWKG